MSPHVVADASALVAALSDGGAGGEWAGRTLLGATILSKAPGTRCRFLLP